jgi:small GTP-binding protein
MPSFFSNFLPEELDFFLPIGYTDTGGGQMTSDLELIKQLEEEIGRKLKEREYETIMGDNKQGFALDVHRTVVGLNLDNFKLERVPESLSIFRNIERLSLYGNKLKDVSGLSGLDSIKKLDLSDNKLSDLSSFTVLSGLTTLDLKNNRIRNVSGLCDLNGLTALYLSFNQINDISGLMRLKNLTILDLRHNNINKFPEEMVDLVNEIDVVVVPPFEVQKAILLYGNPLEEPPLEIIRKGKKAIKTYFQSLRESKLLPLNEVKVLLVGDGGAGKTSLVKRLKGKEFNRNECQTHGINIDEWKLTDKKNGITAHLWDFGGQQIMHATHQFFLSKRSLYILVLDGRKDEEPEYWLKHIESFGGDSHILVVINKIDENPGFEVNRKFLQEKYKNIKGFFRLSCKTLEGVEVFSNALKKRLFDIEIIKINWAYSWFKVKQRLEHMDGHYIDYNQYLKICTAEKIKDKSGQDILVQFLHDLGIVLHFKDLELKDVHVLEPRWVTEAVYKIINSKHLAEHSGVLKLDCLDEILKQQNENDYYYPPEKYNFIIQLMKKFELCYTLDWEKVLIPDLLKKEEPEFEFDYKSSLKFIIQYDFLPKSVMPRFIVRRHKDIKGVLQWRTGVVLEDKDLKSITVVRADERDRKIFIFVTGVEKRQFFSIIRKTLRDINGSFEKLDTTERVPLPDSGGQTVTYKNLVGHERQGKTEIFVGELEKSFSVNQLLDGIEKPNDRQYLPATTNNQKSPPITVFVPPPGPEKKKWYQTIWGIIGGIGVLVAIVSGVIAIIQVL